MSEAEEKRPVRAKKAVAVFVPQEIVKEEVPLVVPEGTGTVLVDLENVTKALDGTLSADPILKKIHTLMFGQGGKKLNIKKNIRLFHGIPKAEQEEYEQTLRTKMDRFEAGKDLKPICKILDLTQGSKDVMIDKVVEFILNPESSGKSYSGGGPAKRKKASSKKAAKKGEKKEKRAPTGFLMFSNANRDKVKAKNPDASFGELGKLLGQQWGKLSDSEKAGWTAKGQEHGGSKGEKKPKKKAKTAKKAASESESSDEDEPLAKGLSAAVKDKIKSIVSTGDLESLSVKKIKAQLGEEFGEDLVEHKSKDIKEFIKECVAAKQ